MFVNATRLPHVLAPECYISAEWYAREVDRIFRPGWHLVSNTAELARPGDFITCEVLGRPLQLRNIDGEFHAYSNVCVHRHCLLSSLAKGRSERIRCQYHGWEYDRHGRTGHIPDPKSFAPFDREADRLEKFRVERCGQLLFVTLDEAAPPLADQLGENFAQLADGFGSNWRHTATWQHQFDVNWKVPIENSVEGYHIPAVHPKTFKVAPTAERTTHVLADSWTMYRTPNVAPSMAETVLFAVEGRIARTLGRRPQASYTHFHLFPNVLVSLADMLGLVTTVTPLGATRCALRADLFCYQGEHAGPAKRTLARGWSWVNRVLARTVLGEDFAIYPSIQAGLAASTHRGCLGAIEERVHAFQQYVHNRVGNAPVDVSANWEKRPEPVAVAAESCCPEKPR
jgi:phenylpropionate dioxygenase-like ring-hydroxylating dioxygenase large terminal subunit